MIALGVATAGSADPRAAVLVALAAFGAFLGDNAAYLLGRRFGPAAARRVFAGERGTRRRAWAERSLLRFGTRIIIGCRFIPGGRTAITLTCGMVGYPRRRFIVATAVAAVIWASYAFFIGRLGGRAFEDRPWAGLLLALGLTAAISVLIEAVRRAWAWRRSRQERARTRAHTGAQERARADTRAQERAWQRRRQAEPAARPHDLHTGCAGSAPRPDVLVASTRKVATGDEHHQDAVSSAAATARPAVTAVAE